MIRKNASNKILKKTFARHRLTKPTFGTLRAPSWDPWGPKRPEKDPKMGPRASQVGPKAAIRTPLDLQLGPSGV